MPRARRLWRTEGPAQRADTRKEWRTEATSHGRSRPAESCHKQDADRGWRGPSGAEVGLQSLPGAQLAPASLSAEGWLGSGSAPPAEGTAGPEPSSRVCPSLCEQLSWARPWPPGHTVQLTWTQGQVGFPEGSGQVSGVAVGGRDPGNRMQAQGSEQSLEATGQLVHAGPPALPGRRVGQPVRSQSWSPSWCFS